MSFVDRDGVIWLDGELVPWRDARVHVLTHTLHYGMGVFEGVRAYQSADRGTCIFRLREHTDRLFRSAHIMRMKIPYTKDELNAAPKLLARQNGLQESYMRPMTLYGSAGTRVRAAELTLHVTVAAWH